MRRTFDDFFNDPCYRKPAIDVYNKSDEYVLHADVPGIQKSDVNVELVGDNNLVIEGEFKPYKGFDRNKLLVNERDCGKFRREIFLSCDLQVDKMSAVIENGILEVRLPKAQRTSSTAWERWCRNSANGISLDARPTVIAFVRKLKLVITIEEFNQLEQDFIKWILTNNLTKLLSYYKKEWQSCQQLWANIYKPKFATGWMVNETNNLIERFFSTLKWKFLHRKKNKGIDMLINILINQCSFYTQINQQIFNEKKFIEIKSRELKAREIAENNMIDIIDPMNGYCIVKSQSNSSKVYEVYLCDGSYCNCQDQSSLLVKHIRAAASVLGGLEIWNLSLDSERIAFYQNNNMMQDQYTLNSNTANQFHEETPDQSQNSLNQTLILINFYIKNWKI
ncbi:unnamed protein product [Rhizophagus irregularis]|nr:unnamed protein product [Rhizophagus irregularis]